MLWKELDGRFVDPSARYQCQIALAPGGALDLLGSGDGGLALDPSLFDTSFLPGLSGADASFVFNAPASFAPTVGPAVAPEVIPAVAPDIISGLGGGAGELGGAVGGGLGGVGDVGGGLVAGGAGDIAGAGLLGALGPAAALGLFALPFEDLIFGMPPPVSVANSIVGPIARSLGLPASTNFQTLASDIQGAGFSPQQIAGYLQQNLPQLANLLQENQPSALTEIIGSGLLGSEGPQVGFQFGQQLIQDVMANTGSSAYDAAQLLEATGNLPSGTAAAIQAGATTPQQVESFLSTGSIGGGAGTGGPAPLTTTAGAPSVLPDIVQAVNPIQTAVAQDMPPLPPLAPPTGGGAGGLAAPPSGGGAAGTGTSAAATGPGGSNLVTGGKAEPGAIPGFLAPAPAPSQAPIELLSPDTSGFTSGAAGTGGTTPPAPPPSATSPAAASPSATPTSSTAPSSVATTTTPSATPTTTAPSGGMSSNPNLIGNDPGTTPTEFSAKPITAEQQAASGGWFQGLKDFAKEYGPLIGLGGSGIGILMSLFGNKLPQQASTATQAADNAAVNALDKQAAPAAALQNAIQSQNAAVNAFQNAAGNLVPASEAGLAQTIQTASPIISQQAGLSRVLGAQAEPLISAETTGLLPPGVSGALRDQIAAGRGAITNAAANLGQAGSSTTGTDIAANARSVLAQIPSILSDLVTKGTGLAQQSGQSAAQALSGQNEILNAIAGLTSATQAETQAAGGVTNAAGGVTQAAGGVTSGANAVTQAADVAANANLNVAKLQLQADQELQTALQNLTRNLALANINPSNVTLNTGVG